MKWSESRSVMSNSLWPHGVYSPWDSPGQNTGVSSLSLLQGNLSKPESNLGFLRWRQILLPTNPQGKPKNTEVGSLSLLQRIFPTQESNWGQNWMFKYMQSTYCAVYTVLSYWELNYVYYYIGSHYLHPQF